MPTNGKSCTLNACFSLSLMDAYIRPSAINTVCFLAFVQANTGPYTFNAAMPLPLVDAQSTSTTVFTHIFPVVVLTKNVGRAVPAIGFQLTMSTF